MNAAGVCHTGRVEALHGEDLQAQLNLNVVGTSLLTRLFAKGKVKVTVTVGSRSTGTIQQLPQNSRLQSWNI